MTATPGDILTPPKYSYDEKTHLGRFLHILCLVLAIILLIPIIHNAEGKHWEALATLILEEVIIVITFWMNRRGMLNWAVTLLSLTFLTTATVLLLTSEQGIRDVAIMIFPALVVIVGLFFNFRNFLLFTLATTLCLTGVIAFEIQTGFTAKTPPLSSWSDVVDLVIILSITAIAARFLGSHLREIARWAKSSEAGLKKWMDIYTETDYGVAIIVATTRSIELSNRALAEMYGRTVDEMRGMPFVDLFAQENRTEVPGQILLAAQTGYAIFQSVHCRNDGSTFPVRVEMTAVRDTPNPPVYLMVHIESIEHQRRQEESLQESAEIYRNILMNAFDGISIIEENPDPFLRRLIDCNERYAQMSGRSKEELLNIGYQYQLTIPLTHEMNHTDIESLGIGNAFRGTMSWIRPDGKDNIIEYTGILTRMRGKTYTIGIDRDITRQTRTEEALRESESRYKYLASCTFEGIVVTISGKIVEVNEQLVEMLGYDSPIELIDSSLLTYVGPESLKLVRENIEKARTKPFEHVMKRKDGSQFYVETLSRLIRYHGEPARLTAVRDTTERKAAEAASRNLEERFQMIFNSVNDPITILDMNGKFLEVNNVACDLLGYEREYLLGKTPFGIEVPKYSVHVTEWVDQIQKKGSLVYESAFKTSAGKTIPVEINSSKITYDGVPAILSVVRDISARKRPKKGN